MLISVSPVSAGVDVAKIAGEPLTMSGWMRTREYVWSYFNRGAPANGQSENQYNYQANVLRIGLGYQLDGVKAFIELMNPSVFDLPSDALPTPGEFSDALGIGANYYFIGRHSFNSNVFLKQGYLEFGQRLLKGLTVKGGRFEFMDGTELTLPDAELRWLTVNEIQQRLIGNFGWSDVMRSFDGAAVSYSSTDWNAVLMYGVPTRGVFELSGMDEISRIDVVYAALNKAFESALGNSAARVFYIWYDDNRHLVPVDNQPPAAAGTNFRSIAIDTLGGNFVHTVRLGPGKADFLVWGGYQFGSWGTLNQRAYAYTAQLGYRFDGTEWQPWLRAVYTVGSGDSNPDNGTHGTFFQILPTPRLYALDPIYNMMNTNDLAAQLIFQPMPGVEWRSDMDALWLSSAHDLWYAGGGAFDSHLFGYTGQPSFGKSYLGTVLDTGLSWKLNHHVSVYFYVGHMFGGSVIGANYPNGREETFGYAESVLTF
jgi:hypothetical protein